MAKFRNPWTKFGKYHRSKIVNITACILMCCSKMIAQIPFPDGGSYALYLQKRQSKAIEAQLYRHLKIRTINTLHYNSKSSDDTMPSGHVIAVIDSLGRETVNFWNSGGTVKTYFFYDASNNVIESRIPKLRHASKNKYDDFNCVSSITTNDTSNIDSVKIETVYFEYIRDSQKRIRTILKKSDSGNKIIEWKLFYDESGQIIKEEIINHVNFRKNVFHFTYASDGILSSCESDNVQKIIYEYTNKQLTREIHLANGTRTYLITYRYTETNGMLLETKQYNEAGKLMKRIEYFYH